MSTAITRAGGGFAIAPTNMAELFNFAKLIAESDLVPKDYRDKPGNCMVAIQMGGELGLSPMQSIQNIAVINGRPSLWGDALLAVCLPHLDEFEETDDGATATCRARRGNRSVTTTFSTEDAKRAGLHDKQGPWKQYPARMRKMRARGFCLRDICADVLRGIQSAEEAQDIPREAVRAEVTSSTPIEEPKQERKSEPPPKAANVGPVAPLSWPDKQWAGKLLTELPSDRLLDLAAWLESISLDESANPKRRAKAEQSLSEVAAETDRRIEQESAAADAAKAAADRGVPDQDPNNGAEADAWGLSSP